MNLKTFCLFLVMDAHLADNAERYGNFRNYLKEMNELLQARVSGRTFKWP